LNQTSDYVKNDPVCSEEDLNPWQNISPLWTFLGPLPFVTFLLVLAIFPLLKSTSHWWESNSNKLILALIAAVLGIAIQIGVTQDWNRVGHTFLDYAAFLALLGALYIVSGGIHISGAFAGFPYVNTIFLGVGALLANLLGTTGASMILIQPLLRANQRRKHKTHIIIFFIFVVSNCGGLLTPLGDPPLYLGFLRGVPFGWTLGLLKPWLFTVGSLLFIFHLLDERIFDRETLQDRKSLISDVAKIEKQIHIQGWFNVGLLACIVGVILVSGYWLHPLLAQAQGTTLADIFSKFFQIFSLCGIAALSYFKTPTKLHQSNHFTFHPIQEVGVIFFGVFGAMIPTMALLEAHGSAMTLQHPWQYFWLTGLLSGFLDNAPTYLTFATMAASQNGISANAFGDLAVRFPALLGAVSCGAVFMGAATYIGNGPNFMVKAIAEHSGIQMPSFGKYLLWSSAILLPISALVSVLFFS
jgi:Na+/H+ antiporter NhaD/arsenite permease-like protein